MTTENATNVVELRRDCKRSLDDASLMTRLIRGDSGARSEFYNTYADHIQRVVSRILGDDPDVPDVMQEVFMVAFAKASTLRSESKTKAWLSQVAVRASLGVLRTRKRRSWLKHDPMENIDERPCQPSDHEGRQLMKDVFDVLDKLAPEERVPFTLRFFEQMDLTEVAESCEVSLATVKRRLRSAKDNFTRIAISHPRLAHRVPELATEGD